MKKVVLITGASAGIGQACADRLFGSGWTVIGASRRGIGSPGASEWAPMAMDVDVDDSVVRGVDAIMAEHGRLDAIVACAGWGLAGPVEFTSLSDAKDQFETNFFGAVRLVHAALPVMRTQKGGRVVLISSIGGLIGIPFQAFYSASKFAMEGYGESLAYEVAPFGIHVTMVEPGNVRTDFTSNRRNGSHTPEPGKGAASPYAATLERALGLMERDEMNGVAPSVVAHSIERVLTAKHPPRRLSVGKMSERIGLPAKRLLPHRVFERAAASSLGV